MKTRLLLLLSASISLSLLAQDEEPKQTRIQALQKMQIHQKEFRAAEPNSFQYFNSIFKMRFTYLENSGSLSAANQEDLSQTSHEDFDRELLSKWFDLTQNWGRFPTEAELNLMVEKKELTHMQPDYQLSYSKVLRETIHKAGTIFIYEGRMRTWGFGDFGVQWVTINEQSFITPEREASPDEMIDLRDLFGTNKYFDDFGGPKACGRFRADYMVEWEVGGELVQLMVCNGCHEIIITHGDKWFKHDFGKSKAPEIKKVMAQFDQKRHEINKQLQPKPKPEPGPVLTGEERAEIEAIMKGLK